MDFKTKNYDVIEEVEDPHAHASAEGPDAEDPDAASRRLRINPTHLRVHGYTHGCRRCDLHKQGLNSRAKHLRHDEACRSRIYLAIKELRGGKSEEEDKRLESRQAKKHDEPKPTTAPDTPGDLSMEMDDHELAGNPEIGGDVEIGDEVETRNTVDL